MNLTAITVCVNYADFLEHVLPINKPLFNRWIIVTDKKDLLTKALCDLHKVECIQTDVFYERGIFNKYAGINKAVKLVNPEDWVLFLDGDIILHYETRRVLEKIELDEKFIYGIDRLNCVGIDEWEKYKAGPGVLKENWLLSSQGMEFGSRLVHYYGHEGENGRFEGWRPLGFFQLCHKSQFEWYDENTLGADHCDLLFARRWPRNRRSLIPELLGIHLESVRANKGVNWYGRKSLPFNRPPEPKPVDIVTIPDIIIEKVVIAPVKKESWFKRTFRKVKACVIHLKRKLLFAIDEFLKWLLDIPEPQIY